MIWKLKKGKIEKNKKKMKKIGSVNSICSKVVEKLRTEQLKDLNTDMVMIIKHNNAENN